MEPITIGPPSSGVDARVHPPGSKSHTIRALFAAALADGTSQLNAPLVASDSRDAINCLTMLGAAIEIEGARFVVGGTGGSLNRPDGRLNAGESGLTARFAIALAPSVKGRTVIEGRGRLPERPMGAVLDAVAGWAEVVSWAHPWEVVGRGTTPGGIVTVDAAESSQMASALMIAAPLAESDTELIVSGLDSSASYLDVTRSVMDEFGAVLSKTDDGYYVAASGYRPATYEVPVDASSAVYPAAVAAVTGGRVEIEGHLAHHPDTHFFDVLVAMGCRVERAVDRIVVSGPDNLSSVEVDMSVAPDASLTVAVLAAVADGESRITGLGSLRHKESDRLEALRSGLSAYGASVRVVDDGLVIAPGERKLTTLESRGDHRMAMAFSILGLIGPEVTIDDGSVVAKTWPEYWEWLATTGALVTRL